MTGNTDFFTPRAQFRRVLAHDWRIYQKDICWGASYALAGFFVSSPRYDAIPPILALNAPFVLLSLAVGIMTYRLCLGESQPATAPFYFNLPRRHDLVQAAHLTLLAAMALGHEALILIAAALGFRLPPGATRYTIPPHMVLLPLFTMAVASWFMYLPKKQGWPIGAAASFTALFLTVFIIGFAIYLAYWVATVKHKTLVHETIDTTILFLLSAFLIIDALRRWRAVQIGALS